jgi:hypothetical protein
MVCLRNICVKTLHKGERIFTNNNNNNNNNNVCLNAGLTAQVNITYKACTKTQIKHRNSTNTQKQNTKQTNQKQYSRKSSIKSTRAKALNPNKTWIN